MSIGMLVTFESEQAMTSALLRLRGAELGEIETYTPKPIETGQSIVPSLMLMAGLLGFAASFCLQSYANTVAYPIDIGGRPNISWPAFVPVAFENAVLAAVLVGFFGYFAVCRLPRLYDPIDEYASAHRVMHDAWCIVVRTDKPDIARTILHEFTPARVENLS